MTTRRNKLKPDVKAKVVLESLKGDWSTAEFAHILSVPRAILRDSAWVLWLFGFTGGLVTQPQKIETVSSSIAANISSIVPGSTRSNRCHLLLRSRQ